MTKLKGIDPRKQLPEKDVPVLVALDDANIFVAEYSGADDGCLPVWHPAGDVGEICYGTGSIEWWCPLPEVEAP